MSDPMADRCPALAPSDVLPLSPRVPGLSPSEPRRCVLYLGHEGAHYAQNSRSWSDPPWRLDVPVVPEHVTCFEDPDGVLWVRGRKPSLRWHQWTQWSADEMAWLDANWCDVYTLLTRAPLVQHPDPRKATTC